MLSQTESGQAHSGYVKKKMLKKKKAPGKNTASKLGGEELKAKSSASFFADLEKQKPKRVVAKGIMVGRQLSKKKGGKKKSKSDSSSSTLSEYTNTSGDSERVALVLNGGPLVKKREDALAIKPGLIEAPLDDYITEAKRLVEQEDARIRNTPVSNPGAEWDPNADGEGDENDVSADADMMMMMPPPPISQSMLQLRRTDSTFHPAEVSLARSMGYGDQQESYTYFEPSPVPPNLEHLHVSQQNASKHARTPLSSIETSPNLAASAATAHEIARMHVNCVHKAFHKEQIVDKNHQIQELKAELAAVLNKHHARQEEKEALCRQLDKAREDISTISSMSLLSPVRETDRLQSRESLTRSQVPGNPQFSRMFSADKMEARKNVRQNKVDHSSAVVPACLPSFTHSSPSSPSASTSSRKLNKLHATTGPLELYASNGKRSPRMRSPIASGETIASPKRSRARTPPLVRRSAKSVGGRVIVSDPAAGNHGHSSSRVENEGKQRARASSNAGGEQRSPVSSGSLSARRAAHSKSKDAEFDKTKISRAQTKDKAIINMLVNWHDQSNKTSEVQKKSQDTETSISSEECVICCEQKRSVVFLPCAHLCSCLSCSSKVTKCPICRVKVIKSVRVYL
jgi:hypothetical protein